MGRIPFLGRFWKPKSSIIPETFRSARRLHSLASQGKQRISNKQIFEYTSGRWLVNEKRQLAKRYIEFNVDNLCNLAASIFNNSSRCVEITKMEGNFNKALLLTMDDGNKVIAKIPCPNTGPPFLTTASEVATLKFLRSRTTVRVPEVLAWSATTANPVGAEYIIMEYLDGIPLSDKWESMNVIDRFKVIDQVVDMEVELQRLKFPAYGSLFLRESVANVHGYVELSPELDPEQLYCVGPSCSRELWLNRQISSFQTPIERGPWTSLAKLASSIIQEETANHQQHARTTCHGLKADNDQLTDEHIDLLHKASTVFPILPTHPLISKSSSPTLWHTDLHLGNIFLSKNDPTSIEGIIDWQSLQIAPLFLQACLPAFLEPPKNYILGTTVPNLPENFDLLNDSEKEIAIRSEDLASRTKYYEMKTLVENREVYDALLLDRRLWRLFTSCQVNLQSGLFPLRNSLTGLSQNWSTLGFSGTCPFSFTAQELEKHEKEGMDYRNTQQIWDIAKQHL
ncbi:hypothetical protein AJ78_04843 [Emergomyces pasteurianus Ep9510]|uniref:Altered inheritance of mitochondria protein 9, mitochondrial n=1 Tax=Emergomyces pasteurianus Ep9510 TaxID=1447872 RepID=A0A1J9QFB8_9EURO|nr:hypothetical protein AJ78_04843 [Emergomyces pasteurianus Ep9510]